MDRVVEAILWDFGDTLCDARFMRAPVQGQPDWAIAYDPVLEHDVLVECWGGLFS